MGRTATVFLHIAVFCGVAGVVLGAGPASPGYASPVLTDSLYSASHPRILYFSGELPDIRARVQAPGRAGDAYEFIRTQVDSVYGFISLDSLLYNDVAMEPVANLGLVGAIEDTAGSAAIALGRTLTLYVAQNFNVDTDAYASGLRLRALSLGYDMFFGDATPAQRALVRDEVEQYVQYMITNINYDLWRHHPYVSNKTAMVSAGLGLAAIAFANEMEPGLASGALAAADMFLNAWRSSQVDPEGAYREGALYALWSLRQLVYYFYARKRFDGFDYSQSVPIRNIERWIAYELDPRGNARVNNIQDCTDYYRPLARHTTYFDWAQAEWGSVLSSYLWEHSAGPWGYDHGDENDRAATVLFDRGVAPRNPVEMLPHSKVWTERGLYYYRSGWPQGNASDDVVFSFYSGVFEGGHAQEDQNQFTLAGYGARLVTDHGAGPTARQSEAHNIVLIDGAGEHNAGNSIGTDGRIVTWLLAEYADYVLGDATQAYTTYSPYNSYGVPYPGIDWSWGYRGANPVQHALRRVLVIHDPATRPYFLIVDDIDKDGALHTYEWRMHTPEDNAVDVSGADALITSPGSGAVLKVHTVHPAPDSLTRSVAYFDNYSEDPNSNVLGLTTTTVNPRFATLLVPRASNMPDLPVVTVPTAWGTTTWIVHGSNDVDIVMVRDPALAPVMSVDINAFAEGRVATDATASSLDTDAAVAVLRTTGGALSRYMAVEATWIEQQGVPLVTILDGPATITQSGGAVRLDRGDANFEILAAGVIDVHYRDIHIPTVEVNGYLTPALVSAAGGDVPDRGLLEVRAYPNPFNPVVSVDVTLGAGAEVRADIFDVRGRRVCSLWSGPMPAGTNTLRWDASSGATRAPSGVYFLRVAAPGMVRTAKLTIVK